MIGELEKRCSEYIANRDAVGKAFRWDNSDVYDVCANLFCACGKTADTERLKACKKIIRKHTKPFSGFRSGNVRAILSSMLSIGDEPESRMATANDYFRLLRRKFRKSEYLVLTAFLLADLVDRPLTEEKAARGQEIFRLMNQKHRILTNKTDSVFAMLLAYTDRPADELTEEVEACYQALKARFSGSGSVQTASQVLASAPGTPEEKTQRLTALYDALTEAGIKYGSESELPPLAGLSLSDTPVPALVEEIRAADEFLKTQEGYGSKESEQKKRAMHAVMIVSDRYAGTDQVNVTVMTNTLDMLISKQNASRLSLAVNVLQAVLEAALALKDGKEETK